MQSESNRRWEAANPEKVRDRVRRQARRAHNFIVTHKAEQGCADCGERDVRCLDLDHNEPVPHKRERGAMYLVRDIRAGKITVRCANCHRKRHCQVRETRSIAGVPQPV